MAESAAFTLVCEHLESAMGLERPAARGTVRLALKEAGLDAETVTPAQMQVVTEKVLPTELQALRISDVEGHCQALRGRLKKIGRGAVAGPATPEDVFERLGGDS